MGNDIQVNLGFTADIEAAKAQIQQLQVSLSNLTKNARLNDNSLGFSAEIQKSITLASELQVALKNAVNIKTGSLDLSKFSDSLSKNGTSLSQYAAALGKLGPTGAQVFSQLASAITTAEIPLKRTNTLLTDFASTMKNTIKWQLSSSIVHGLMSETQEAFRYAQDLNQSLTNIRIVSGKSADEMSRFAEKANQAAKALSATTLDYTNASLIYAQQGLDDAQIEERTAITLKMAHAAGQSTQEVSNQLTAVWNNYANGSEDLEHFADAMVKLGADTASSSDEIAQGLEKFAAIGDTVGLSFDNAAAALATVTATTRQSADVVGTAFKTLFARMQDLELGETLEDGTTLGQYAEGLASVGINIKEANGELKDMDNIIYELGIKWDTISKDQQVALAQTVAGKLIVLMLA